MELAEVKLFLSFIQKWLTKMSYREVTVLWDGSWPGDDLRSYKFKGRGWTMVRYIKTNLLLLMNGWSFVNVLNLLSSVSMQDGEENVVFFSVPLIFIFILFIFQDLNRSMLLELVCRVLPIMNLFSESWLVTAEWETNFIHRSDFSSKTTYFVTSTNLAKALKVLKPMQALVEQFSYNVGFWLMNISYW